MRSTPVCVFFAFFFMQLLAVRAFAQADTVLPQRILQGEARTLPEGIVRTRLPVKFSSGSSGFSSAALREESGFRFNSGALAGVFEYGYSDAVSVQLIFPFVFQNKLVIDGKVFQQTSVYSEKYDSFINSAAKNLVAGGLCAEIASCVDAINRRGLSLSLDTLLTLPTGELLPVKAGVPLRDVASSLVTRAAIPENGTTGIGDIEVGLLIALADPRVGLLRKDWPLSVSAGAGVRLPSGSFSDVPSSKRGTGRGTLDLGLRANVDWQWWNDFVFSFQHQLEFMLVSGQKKRSSLLDNSSLNQADPTRSGADQISNTAKFTRDSMRHVGFFKISLGCGHIADTLSPFNFYGQYKYDFDSRTSLGGVQFSPASELQSVLIGLEMDGLAFNLPLQLGFDYEVPMIGRDRPLAPRVLTATLKSYYKL